jgi:hypothetical protein
MTLDEAIEIAKIGAPHGYRWEGGGEMWDETTTAAAHFHDWGLAKATAIILTAVIKENLVKAAEAEAMRGLLRAMTQTNCNQPVGAWWTMIRATLDGGKGVPK